MVLPQQKSLMRGGIGDFPKKTATLCHIGHLYRVIVNPRVWGACYESPAQPGSCTEATADR